MVSTPDLAFKNKIIKLNINSIINIKSLILKLNIKASFQNNFVNNLIIDCKQWATSSLAFALIDSPIKSRCLTTVINMLDYVKYLLRNVNNE